MADNLAIEFSDVSQLEDSRSWPKSAFTRTNDNIEGWCLSVSTSGLAPILTTQEEGSIPTSKPSNSWTSPFNIFRFQHSETFASRLSKTVLDLQETQPTFVPKFINLRKTCLEHTENKLRTIETSLANVHDENTKSRMLDEAVLLLRQLDKEIEGELTRHQLEDPSYVENCGIDVVHFALGDRAAHKQGQWMMITHPWGKDAKSIIEQDHSKLAKLYQMQVEDFAGHKELLSNIYFKRKKRILERQPGAVKLNHETGAIVIVPHVLLIWKIVFSLAILALILFFGVGVIATNSTFSKLFQKIFFWVAIIWTLTPSIILAWLVRAVGGSDKDVASVFLASIAIWLVVIQIGQTHLITQVPQMSSS